MKSIVAVAAFLVLGVGVLGAPQTAPEESPQAGQAGMMERMQQMMETRRQQMEGERGTLIAELRTSGERLDMLVDGMNAAQGTGKTEAIAAAVTELAAQHDRLLELIESQPGMMRQMQMMQMMDMMQQMQGTGGMQGMPGR